MTTSKLSQAQKAALSEATKHGLWRPHSTSSWRSERSNDLRFARATVFKLIALGLLVVSYGRLGSSEWARPPQEPRP